ncbi:hypothetical protein OUZ56_003273 [Daphnia magna]|uniref:Uncharacterized protein n=1 Tax=Daphnia magna TaxID=35525 RepID=A0ABR0A8A3_9CRUS|nr:hypothetical protein OUZ56_003273 [Daphnia magna]
MFVMKNFLNDSPVFWKPKNKNKIRLCLETGFDECKKSPTCLLSVADKNGCCRGNWRADKGARQFLSATEIYIEVK